MWILYRLLNLISLSVVNYTDEYLSNKNTTPESQQSLHRRVGSLIVISTLLTALGALVITALNGHSIFPEDETALIYALLSAPFALIMYAAYFYSLDAYPVSQVSPMILLSTVYLLFFEIAAGSNVSAAGVFAIGLILFGSYLLDVGEFKWNVPSKLLLMMSVGSFGWALSMYFMRLSTESIPASQVYVLHLFGVFVAGLFIFIFVKPYRKGFIYRVKSQAKVFVGISLINEFVVQISYLALAISIAKAPLVSYVASMEGIATFFVLIWMYFFPITEKSMLNKVQLLAICCIAFGVFALSLST